METLKYDAVLKCFVATDSVRNIQAVSPDEKIAVWLLRAFQSDHDRGASIQVSLENAE